MTLAAKPERTRQADQQVRRLREMAVRGLRRMYRPQDRLFAFHLHRTSGGIEPAGISRRYTAIALVGLAGESAEVANEALAGHSPPQVCERLAADLPLMGEPGEVALTLWAVRAMNLADAQAMAQLEPVRSAWSWPIVETVWVLSAMCAGDQPAPDHRLARWALARLMRCFDRRSHLFAHHPDGGGGLLRGHITCFADFVYPVQALSNHHRLTGDARALELASLCAGRICSLQGPDGQWWWHYDVRTGRVVEGYPVYSVHQDGMAPMALHALRRSGGPDCTANVQRGMDWLASSPELDGASLVDVENDLIWRKVFRREPRKLARGLQALASRMHPRLRVPGTSAMMPPGAIDYESRPYHMGWILHAWPTAGQTRTAKGT